MGLAVPLLQRLAVAAERFLFQGSSRRVPTGTRKLSEGSNRDQEEAGGFQPGPGSSQKDQDNMATTCEGTTTRETTRGLRNLGRLHFYLDCSVTL